MPPLIGVDWHTTTTTAAFGVRFRFGVAVFQNQMWVIAGSNLAANLADVWHSADGATWTAATGNGGFQGGPQRCVASFGGALWTVPSDKSAWSSPDGVTWTKQLAALPYTGGGDYCAVFNSQI